MAFWDDVSMRKTGTVTFVAMVNSAGVWVDIETRYSEANGSVTGCSSKLVVGGREPEDVIREWICECFDGVGVDMDFAYMTGGADLVFWGASL